jgi:cell division protein FtsA
VPCRIWPVPEEMIEVPSVGARPPRYLSRQTLADVVEPRYEELLGLVQAVLRRSGYEDLIAAGVVLTGGSSKMDGVLELAEKVFNVPVRLGYPKYVTGLVDVVRNPIHATGVGLLLFGHRHRHERVSEMNIANGGLKSIFGRMSSWFRGNF